MNHRPWQNTWLTLALILLAASTAPSAAAAEDWKKVLHLWAAGPDGQCVEVSKQHRELFQSWKETKGPASPSGTVWLSIPREMQDDPKDAAQQMPVFMTKTSCAKFLSGTSQKTAGSRAPDRWPGPDEQRSYIELVASQKGRLGFLWSSLSSQQRERLIVESTKAFSGFDRRVTIRNAILDLRTQLPKSVAANAEGNPVLSSQETYVYAKSYIWLFMFQRYFGEDIK